MCFQDVQAGRCLSVYLFAVSLAYDCIIQVENCNVAPRPHAGQHCASPSDIMHDRTVPARMLRLTPVLQTMYYKTLDRSERMGSV